MSEIRLVRLVFQLDKSNDQSYSYRYWIVYYRIFYFLSNFLFSSRFFSFKWWNFCGNWIDFVKRNRIGIFLLFSLKFHWNFIGDVSKNLFLFFFLSDIFQEIQISYKILCKILFIYFHVVKINSTCSPL